MDPGDMIKDDMCTVWIQGTLSIVETAKLGLAIGGDARIAKMNSQNPGTNSMENILDKGINPEGIAFDWVHQKIYWTDSRNRSVYSMNTDGSQIGKIHFYCKLLEHGLSSIRGGMQN